MEVDNLDNEKEIEVEATVDEEERRLLEEEIASSAISPVDFPPEQLVEETAPEEPAEASGETNLSKKEQEKQERERLKQIQAERKKELERLRLEQNKAIACEQTSSKGRFKYLLQQTEIFSHFMSHSKKEEKSSGASSSGGSGSRRGKHKLSEVDEDDEIMREAMEEVHADGGGNISGTRLTVTPSYITTGKLRPYQLEGLNWLIKLYDSGINGILADEMGLGKTLQTISFLGYLKHLRGVHGPHLVIAPKSVMPNWLKEINRFCPSLRAFRFHGSQEERNQQKQEELVAGKFDVCVTSFEVVIREKAALRKFNWRYIVIDEAHRIKNEKSVLSQVVRQLSSQFRLLLTGTPLQNNLHELWALLNFLLPDIFDSAEDFDSWFDVRGGQAETEIVEQLHKILKPFMIRRLKADVERDLPPKKEVFVECSMSEVQRNLYKSLLSKNLESITSGADKVRLLNIVMQLRKACNHPYLFDGIEQPPFETGEHLVDNAGKMAILDKLLKKLQAAGSRVLIFSQMTRMLDILEDYCVYRGFSYCRIDGQTAGEDRERSVEEFNAPGSSKFLFLLSTRAGGLGINLATADTVVLYDSDWNPQADLQAQDRAHRIGQTKPVTVFRFVTTKAIEEKVYQRAMKKLYLDAVVIQRGRLAEQNKAMSKEELLSMVRWGAEEVFKTRDSAPVTEEDIDALLSRGEETARDINERIQKDCQHNLLSFSLEEDANLYEFEGMDYSHSPTRTLCLQNIAESVTEERIRQALGSTEPDLRQIKISRPRASALLYFKSVPSATDALQALQSELESFKQEGEGAEDARVFYSQSAEDALKGMIVTQGLEPTRRERKINYSIDGYYRLAMNAQQAPKGPKGPKKLHHPPLHDFQFYNKARLQQLFDKEIEFAKQEFERKQKETADEKKGKKKQQDDEDEQTGLTPEEEEEKEHLLSEGFGNWTRADFNAFVRGCEAYGRDDYERIAGEVGGTKAPADVRKYAAVFWARHTEIDGWEQKVKRIEKGEAALERQREVSAMLRWKTSQVANPWVELRVPYPVKDKKFTEEEDRFILCMAARLGVNNWEDIRRELRFAWEFRFDWFIKTRTAKELEQRCTQLLKYIEKEWTESKECKQFLAESRAREERHRQKRERQEAKRREREEQRAREAKERAEREAKERAEREAKEAKEKAEREQKEKEERERKEAEEREKQEKQKAKQSKAKKGKGKVKEVKEEPEEEPEEPKEKKAKKGAKEETTEEKETAASEGSDEEDTPLVPKKPSTRAAAAADSKRKRSSSTSDTGSKSKKKKK